MSNIIKAILIGIVEGITEWLPVSSTGHMILLDEFIQLDVTAAFRELFLVVIQLGAVLSVAANYFRRLFPFFPGQSRAERREVWSLWSKILVSSIPAGVIGVLFDDKIDEIFFNWQTVAGALILYGIIFIAIERRKPTHGKHAKTLNSPIEFSYQTALFIGFFQLLALIPGTSRSGATIIGAILLGASRSAAAEYTFFLALPAMLGAGLIKLLKFGFSFTSSEALILAVGCVTAFIVSLAAIRFLVGFVKKHDFAGFGIYRIALGAAVIGYFALAR